VRWLLVVVLVISACKKRSKAPQQLARHEAAAGDAAPADAAPADAAIDAMTERARFTARLAAYLELLSIDYWTFELLATFPGVPPGTTFHTVTYSWHAPPWIALDVLQAKLVKLRASTAEPPHAGVDDAVRAYLDVHARWLPRLLDLYAYYEASHFVDDEFDRARREAGDVATARAELAAVRGEMRQRVLTEWRELSGDIPESPRAIVGRAWEACLGFEDLVMTVPYDAKPVAAAISACRRSIPTVTALPKRIRGDFDDRLRAVAILIGDHMEGGSGLWGYEVTNRLASLTDAYLALWPALPTEPPERPAP
jgi:Protein of unknown function (DUF3829)